MLRARNLSVAYGPIRAVRDCSFEVRQGELIAVVGANGAGKSTLMRALSGVVPIAGGNADFDGAPISAATPDALLARGLVHIPEGRGTLRHLTVRENLLLAHDMRRPELAFEAAVAAVFERFPRLKERLEQPAGNLSGGEQQMLAIGRALVQQPRLLLVDEPSLGLSPLLAREAFAVLADFRRSGVTILLVEQNVKAALALADRGYVLRTGEIVLDGSGSELAAHPQIVSQYLGVQQNDREKL